MATWMIVLVSIAAVIKGVLTIFVLYGYIYRALTKMCPKHLRMDGKTVIVTGSSAGIGKETALDLARRGARVIMACRNMAKAQAVADDIICKSRNKDVVVRHLELSDFQSIRKFAAKINEEEEAVHVLINNAGSGGYPTKRTTENGHELTFATNYLGPFLLTHLLLAKLKSSAPSRVINVSSIAYIFNQLDLADVNFERRRYVNFRAYSQSKLADILFTKVLAKRLHGTGVTANTLHTGLGFTDIIKGPDPDNMNFWRKLKLFFGEWICRTAEQSAQTQIYLAVSEEGGTQSGAYYENCQKNRLYFDGNNMELAKQLWDASRVAVKLSPEDTIPELL